MTPQKRLQTAILVLGDMALFYISLYLALSLRYGAWVSQEVWQSHQTIFFFIHFLWLIIFYIVGAYDTKDFVSYKKIIEKIVKSMTVAGITAIIIFYLVPTTTITPKTNLLIDVLILSGLLIIWRKLFWNLTKNSSGIRTLFFGSSQEITDFAKSLKNNHHLGYGPSVILKSIDDNFINLVKKENIQVIVASKEILKEPDSVKKFYEAIPLGVTIVDFPTFYETLTDKIPVSIINEEWFLENLREIDKKIFEKIKKVFDIVMVAILGIPTLALFPIIAFLIKIDSRGPVFYKQKRVGKNGSIFEIIKFRTMIENAEKNGPQWAEEKDSRITAIGRFLRKTRIDELPQLVNILRGEMSFVGPRAERPEFVKNLEKEIPHYAMRYLVKPGASGWAQIKLSHGGVGKEAREKLQYDLYYIKNRSIVLDLAIVAKTIATMISREGC